MRCIKLFSIITLIILASTNVWGKNEKETQSGFFSRITQNDTIYFALIDKNTTGEDLDAICLDIKNFGSILNVYDIRLNEGKLDYIGLEYFNPRFETKKGEYPLNNDINGTIGAYYNIHYGTPFDLAVLDEEFLMEFIDLNKIFSEFKDISKVRIMLNDELLTHKDYDNLKGYKLFDSSKVREIATINNTKEQSITIRTK